MNCQENTLKASLKNTTQSGHQFHSFKKTFIGWKRIVSNALFKSNKHKLRKDKSRHHKNKVEGQIDAC